MDSPSRRDRKTLEDSTEEALRPGNEALERPARAEAALRESEARLAIELADMKQLQQLSSQLIEEDKVDALYEQIMAAAITLMRSDMGSLQRLYPERNELRLLAWQGFDPASAAFWEWVRLDSTSTCGATLRTGEQVIVPDVEDCDFMAGTADLDFYRLSGIKAVQSTPLISRSGRVVGMISTHWREPHRPLERELRLLDVLARQAADLIERKVAEETLRASEERLRQAISIETVGVIFFNLEGTIIEANDAFLRMSGHSREALQVGKLNWRELTPPEFMPQSLQAIEELKTVGQSTPYEKQYLRSDGSRWWGIFAAKRLAEGEVVEFIVDTTKRKRVEEALRLSGERLRLLIESVQDYAIFTLDPGGRVTSWNEGARRLKGYGAEEIVGHAVHLFYTPADRAAGRPEAEMQTALELGRSEDESLRVRKDGSQFWANEIMTPLRAEDGRLLGFTKISRDLTERRRFEAMLEKRVRERTQELYETNTQLQAEIVERRRVEGELHESEAQLRRMASRLTLAEQEERHRLSQMLHDDLQQLLYGIQLKLEFVRDGFQNDNQAGLAGHAEEAITWLQGAIERTRQITVDLSPPVLKGDGLADALAWLAPQMGELHGLRVELEATRDFPIDNEEMRVLLFQIIRELLFNVVKHAGTDRARVALQEEGGRLVIRVSDGGQGFEVAAVEADQEGGFGLFSIRERLGLFGGRLEIESRPGEGTRITVYTPVTVN